MHAMVLTQACHLLQQQTLPIPTPKKNQVRIRVEACGVCRTDIHIVQGELPLITSPLILGHQIVGRVDALGEGVLRWKQGDRIGIPWLGHTCQQCTYCQKQKENLCDHAQFTGYHLQGGFAEYATCFADYAVAIPPSVRATHVAPFLCAGLIGFRAYRAIQPSQTIGLYGFGSSAHIIIQIAKQEGKEVFVFTRVEDIEGRHLALQLGAVWAGSSYEDPPKRLDGAIIFAPVGDLFVQALRVLNKGGICVSAGIHMSDIPSFPYKDLFMEKRITCVSHLTRADSADFFSLIPQYHINTTVHTYPLIQANEALQDLQDGKKKGSFVLIP